MLKEEYITVEEISKEFGMTKTSVRAWLSQRDILCEFYGKRHLGYYNREVVFAARADQQRRKIARSEMHVYLRRVR